MIFLFEDRKSDACTTIVSCLVDGKHGRGVLNKEVDFSSFLYLFTLVLNLVVWFVSSDLSDEWAQRWAGDFELNPDLHLPAENKFIGQYKHKLWSLDKIHLQTIKHDCHTVGCLSDSWWRFSSSCCSDGLHPENVRLSGLWVSRQDREHGSRMFVVQEGQQVQDPQRWVESSLQPETTTNAVIISLSADSEAVTAFKSHNENLRFLWSNQTRNKLYWLFLSEHESVPAVVEVKRLHLVDNLHYCFSIKTWYVNSVLSTLQFMWPVNAVILKKNFYTVYSLQLYKNMYFLQTLFKTTKWYFKLCDNHKVYKMLKSVRLNKYTDIRNESVV